MIYLFLSIATSTLIFIVFKLIARNKINTLQAIVVNYVVCVIEGLIAQGDLSAFRNLTGAVWFLPAVFMGMLFISVFYVTALTVKYSGMAVASIANKLSLIIPATLAFILYGDPVTFPKIAGILAAMVAVVLASYKKEPAAAQNHLRYIIYPALVLAGSGIIDACAKYCQENYLETASFNLFLICVFGTAAFSGILILIVRYLKNREFISMRSIGHGVLLGIPNYGSMYFLIAALNHPMWNDSSVFFPLNNISIVITTAICGWIIFKEKLSGLNLTGILLAIAAICMITFERWW